MRDITSDRFALVKTSDISIQPRMDTDSVNQCGFQALT